jgi:tetratricopeptide (TPR) repeat protein
VARELLARAEALREDRLVAFNRRKKLMRFSKRGKRRLIVVAVALCVVVVGVVGWRIARKAQVRRLTAQARVEGMADYEEGRFATALPKLSYYLARNQCDVEALLAFADARARVPVANDRHLNEAIGLYRAALQCDPVNREALEQLLRRYFQEGRRSEYLEIADRLLALDPRDVRALDVKSIGLFYEGQLDEATAQVEQLIEIEPDRLLWRSRLLEFRGVQVASHEPLVAICDAWIDSHEDGDGRFHLLKARVLGSARRIEEARNEGRLAARRGAGSLEVFESMLDLLDQLRLHDEANRLTNAARESFPEAQQVTAILVHRHWRVGALDQAQAELDRHAADEKGIELVRWQALLSTASNDDEEAERSLDALVALAENLEAKEQVALLVWADALRASRRLEQSTWLDTQQACQVAIAQNPQDTGEGFERTYLAILHYLTGQAYAYVGEHELAADSFERAVALDQHWVAPRLARARSLLAAGQGQEALAVSVEMFRRWKSLPLDAYFVLARAWMAAGPPEGLNITEPETGRPVDLVALLEDTYERSGKDSRFAVLLVEAYAAAGRNPEAIDLIDEFRARRGVSATTLLALADASARRGFGLEQSLVERALEIAGPTLEIIGIQAELLRRQGRTEEGLRLIETALGQGPGAAEYTPAFRQMRAAYLARAGHDSALQALSEVLEADEASLTAAIMVLQQPIAWEDRELTSLAIERLGTIVGEQAPRFRYARAEYVLRFEADDAAKLTEARSLISEELLRNPDSLPARTLMSRLMLAGDSPDVDRAVTHLRRAVDSHPDQVQLYPRLIDLFQRQGDFGSAGEYLRRLGDQAALPPQLRRAEVGLLQVQGDFSAALVRLAPMIDASSSESDLLALALLQWRAGAHDEAERTFERLLAAADRSPTLFEAAAGFYASTGRLKQALALLEDAPELRAPPGTRALLLGRIHQKYGDLDQATAFLQDAVAAAPDRPETWAELARHWLFRRDTEQARRITATGLQDHPDDPVLLSILAMLSLDEDASLLTSQGAGNEVRRATVSLYARARNETGNLVPQQRDLADARKLLQDFPLYRPAWHLAVLLHSVAGRPEESIALARQAASRFPADAAPAQWAVELLDDAGLPEEALDWAYVWRQRSLDDPLAADCRIASLLLDLGQPAAAVRQLAPHADRILASPDRLADDLVVWIRALLLDGQYAAAAAVVEPLMAEDERWPESWLEAAATADVETTVKALALAEPYLATKPRGALILAEHWLRVAWRSDEASHFGRAEELALMTGGYEALAIRSWHVLASIAEVRGNLDEAEALYGQILARNPQDLRALNNRAYVLVQLGRCEEATALSERALKLEAQNPDVLDTHAQALICRGDFGEAETAIRMALSSRPDDPVLVLTLVRSLIGQSRLDEAEYELDRAEALLRSRGLTSGPSWTDLEALREQLEGMRPQPVR